LEYKYIGIAGLHPQQSWESFQNKYDTLTLCIVE